MVIKKGAYILKMKKILGIIAAGVMILAMGITTMAADSPVSSGVVQGIAGGTEWHGGARLGMRAVSDEGIALAAELDDDMLREKLGSAYTEGMQVVDVQEIYVAEGDASQITGPVTVTFTVPGVTAGTKVAVLCCVNGEWTVVENVVAGEGTVTVTLDSLGILAFVIDKNTLSSGTGSTAGTVTGVQSVTSSKTSGATSPKTGESSAVMGLGLAALLAAGGAFGLSRKKRA